MSTQNNLFSSQKSASSKRGSEHIFASSDKPSFWLLHLVGWTAYVAIFSFDNIFIYTKDTNFEIILPLSIIGCIAAILTLPLRYIYKKCWNLRPRNLILVIISASLLVAIIWTPAKNLALWYFESNLNFDEWVNSLPRKKLMSSWALLFSLSYSFFIVFVWSSLYFGINYHYRLMHEKQLHLQAARLSHSAQIKMLRYQINPHFLFNTLNAISTLVLQGKKDKANGMLSRLSTFLRFSLDNDPEKKVPLYDEIKALMLYLEIEKMRFDERLSITIKIPEETESLLVPSLILQPLIENSIKYAIANMESGGLIAIEAFCENNFLHLSVTDNGPGLMDRSTQHLKATTCSGIGLNNIRERLAVLYPQNHQFKIRSPEFKGYKVDIVIPMELS